MKAIVEVAGPLTVYALAKQAGRNYSNVHRDVGKLLEHRLVSRDLDSKVYVPTATTASSSPGRYTGSSALR